MYDGDLKHAWELYHTAVSTDGAQKKRLLREAMNVLNMIPAGYGDSDKLRSYIEPML